MQVLMPRMSQIYFHFVFQADPYLVVSLGEQEFDDKDIYKPYTVNPVFGR